MSLKEKIRSRMDERKRAGIRYAFIALVLIVTVWVTVSVVSYLSTWRQDQSYVPGTEVLNAASTTGFSIGKFLVTESFGLAALCIVVFLILWSAKLLWSSLKINLRKAFFGLLTLSFLLSWMLAYADIWAGNKYFFGGGLGGRCGSAIVGLFSGVGYIVAGCILLALLFVWLFCMSKRFSDWVMNRRPKKEEEPQEEPLPEEPQEEPLPEPQPQYEPEPVQVSPFVSSSSDVDEQEPEAPSEEETPDQEKLTVVTDDTLEQEVKEPLKPIDNRLDPPDGLPYYKVPSLDLLGDYTNARHEVSQDELSRNNNKIRATLANYKVQLSDVTAIVGPTVTLYKVYPAPGVNSIILRANLSAPKSWWSR